MLNRWLTPALVLGLALAALSLPTAAAEKADDAQIKKLVEQLGSDTYGDRVKATEELDKIGPPALPALRKAAKDGDAEVSRRAEELVSRIEKRGETASILAPTKVHLIVKDAPVAQAVGELSKKSGYHIVLADPENKLKDRLVTLDTGEVTFWQAFDQLCEKAGLVEGAPSLVGPPPSIDPRPTPRPRPAPRPAKEAPADKPAETKPLEGKTLPAREGKALNAIVADKAEAKAEKAEPAPGAPGAPSVAGRVPNPYGVAVPAGQITLVDGKPEKATADYSGAVRVRALAKAENLPRPGAGDILLALQASPEPKLRWQSFVALKIDKALDDNDQKLEQSMGPAVEEAADLPRPVVRPGVVIRGLPGVVAAPAPLHATIPLWLKKGDKASKSLKELSGVITAEVLTPAKAWITVDDLMKAEGKTIKGPDGGSIKINKITKLAGGQVQIRVEVEAPPGIVPADNGGENVLPPGIDVWIAPAGPGAPGILPVVPPAKAAPRPGLKAAAPARFGALAVDDDVPALPAVPAVRLKARADLIVVANGVRGNNSNGLTLRDAKGEPVAAGFGVSRRATPDGVTTEYIVTTQDPKGAEPAKLVFSGSKRVTLDIPFTLKNVPLP